MEPKKAEMIARDLMNFYCLESWKFEMRDMKSLFGFCHLKNKVLKLSSLLTELNTDEKVIDVILHEIAHALAPRRAHHGIEWKKIATSIGCTATRCYDKQTIQPPKAFIGICPQCGKIIEAHRRRKISCGKCDPKYNPSLLFKWRTK